MSRSRPVPIPLLFILVALLSLGLSSCQAGAGAAAAKAASFAGNLNAVLSGLRELANEALDAGDQVAANRLDEAHKRAELLLPVVDSVSRGLVRNGNAVVDNASGELFGILGSLRTDMKTVGDFATANVNSWLSEVASLLDVLLDVPPSVLAVSPSVFGLGNAPRDIRISGFLPGRPGHDLIASVNGQTVAVERASGHSLSLPIDLNGLTAGQELVVKLRVRQRIGPLDWFWTWHEFTERVRVSTPTPFKCICETLAENASFLETVTATKAFAVEASTQGPVNRPTENRYLTARDLFVQTLGDSSSLYDLSTVTLLSPNVEFTSYGQCGGDGPSMAPPVVADGNRSVRIVVHAPYLADKLVRIGYSGGLIRVPKYRHCRAGGTKGIASLRPTFRAARKTSTFLARTRTDTLQFGEVGVQRAHMFGDAQPWAYHVACEYKDGSEAWSSAVGVLNRENRSTRVRGLVMRVEDDKLYLEPEAPLRFASERVP